MSRFRPGPRGDRGASAVEFALLFPIFAVLAFGTIAAGTTYSKQINITQAARETSRYGATYDFVTAGMSVDAWLTAVDRALQESAGSVDNPLGGYDYRCVAIVTTDPSGNVVPAKSHYIENGASTSSLGACPGTTKTAKIPSTDYVQVAIARKTSFFMLFATPTLQLDAISFTPFEGKPLT